MKRGFTLAEVLITLVIIGIIASMTIPSIINDQKDKEILARLKKSYSTLSQVMMLSQSFNGSYTSWGIQDNSDDSSQYTFENYIAPYLNNSKHCLNTDGCWSFQKSKGFDGNNEAEARTSGIGGNNVSFILADGTFVSMDIYGSNVETVFGVTENLSYPTLIFAVDLNGDRGPNQIGRDVFMFVLTENGLVPAGKDNSSARCYTGFSGAYAGFDCAAKVLKTGSVQY